MRMCALRALGLALIVVLWSAPKAAAHDAVEKFYNGRTITSIVPFGPGGGYAIYNQIMARHLGKFIPGNPQIVPQYRPGAGGIVASNYVYNVAPRDGSVVAMVSDAVALASVIDADKAKYKVSEFIWLGAIERVNVDVGRSFILPPEAPAERVQALRAAFDRMVKDAAFIDEITKAGFQLSPASGAEVQEAVARATRLDAALIRIVQDTISRAK